MDSPLETPSPAGATSRIEILCHAPIGRLAARALSEAARDLWPGQSWEAADEMADPGVDAVKRLSRQAGRKDLLSTCSPVIVQAPLMRRQELLHRGITPVALLSSSCYLLVVPAASEIGSVREVAEALSRRRTKTAGFFTGSIAHVIALLLGRAVAARFDYSLKPSQQAVLEMLASGEIDWLFAPPADALPLHERKLVRILAVTARERLAELPEVPTLIEAGIDLEFTSWSGVIAPPGLDARDLASWTERLRAIVGTPAWQRYLRASAQISDYRAGREFAGFLDEEALKYELLMKAFDL